MTRERSATRYHRLQLVLGAVGLVIGAGWLVALTFTGVAAAVVRIAARVVDAWWWQVAVVAAGAGAGHAVLTFPLAVVRGYVLPRRYALLHQRFASWLLDRVKAGVLGAAFAVVVLETIYGLARLTPLWWLLAAAFVTLASLVIAVVLPVWIVPLFYRLTPLADDSLRDRLLALARRSGVPAIGVWVVDQSRKSRTANAAVVGLGATRRIILFDTLLAEFRPREIEAVLGHELAHHVHGDTWRGLAAQAVISLVTFAAADRILLATAGGVGIQGPADPAGVPWLALVLGTLGLVAVPISNALSRRLERRADDFALAVTGDADGFVGAMERLADLNLAERNPPRLKEILLDSHPALDRRIARARRWRAPSKVPDID